MFFEPFVLNAQQEKVHVDIVEMTDEDAEETVNSLPKWQTAWTSKYISNRKYMKYAAKIGSELIALVAYEISEILIVHIVYMEAQPASNPTLDKGNPKYTGIGRMLVAYGIKLSIDNELRGEVLLEAKTTELAHHYERDFGAVRTAHSGLTPQYLIADEAAREIFSTYLEQEGEIS